MQLRCHKIDLTSSSWVPEKHLLLLYWLCQSLWLCWSRQNVENSEMGIPDHLICLLRNLYAGQEAPVRSGHGTIDQFQTGKEYVKAVYCPLAYLTYIQSTSCKMPGWMKFKWETRLPGEISTTSDMQKTSLLWQKTSWWKWKNLLTKEKEKSEKVGLKFSIQKTNIMASVSSVHGK